MRPFNLRCEYMHEPLGIDTRRPLLSWELDADERCARQTAYQIRVVEVVDGSKRDSLLWDSGKVASGAAAQVAYSGPALRSGMRCAWQVRSWDQNNSASVWSARAAWELGLLQESDWSGAWIGATTETDYTPAPFLRHTFTLDKKVASARLYLCGLGYYELHCNGKRIGDHHLDPGFTRYDRRALYVAYDMTPFLHSGTNALGVILGTGWQNVHTRAVWYFDRAPWRAAPCLRADLHVRFADGSSEIISTDPTWKFSTGPIVFDSIYGGETYDARLEMPGWDAADFDDRNWKCALVVPGPGGRLKAQAMPPIRSTQTLAPKSIREPKPGVFVFDIGQNLSGHARLTVAGTAGTRITMRYGERLHPDGTLDADHIQQHQTKTDPPQQFQTDTYVCKGTGVETWEPQFVYHGFQYVEVTGFPGRPGEDSLRAMFTHTDVSPAGEFTCSNPLLNRIWRNTRWSYLSNLASIPTDCPHREKNGWTGDAHLAAEQGILSFDAITFYQKWIDDIGDEQRPSGELPGIVPSSGWGYEWGNGPAWDSAFLLIPWYLTLYYGDTQTLESHYEGMRRYVDYLTTRAEGDIVSIGLGDWVPWKTETPIALTSTAYYYRDARIVSTAADLLGKHDDAQRYAALAERISAAFRKRFYQPESHTYGNGSQTSLSCALYQGLVPDRERQNVGDSLIAAVHASDDHIDTGILGAKYLLHALTDIGHADLAYRVATQTTQPGWGWWIDQGATTLWESWGGTDSRNHIMFGDISAWFVQSLAGINPDPDAPGFRNTLIKPHVVGDLTSASARYDSIRGRIESSWRLAGETLTLHVRIPANSTATVFLPTTESQSVTEGDISVDNLSAKGVRRLRDEKECTVLEIGSGSYEFKSAWRPRRDMR